MIYKFDAETIDGEIINFDKYKGKVLLIVNTASKCGFTVQYKGLEALYQKYKDSGLEILGFPCDQFGNQEPGDESQIKGFCELNYGVSFQLFAKIEVNGDDAHPLYKFLRSEKKGIMGDKIKWNFTKFLVDREGNVISRFAPTIKPEKLSDKIENLLSQK